MACSVMIVDDDPRIVAGLHELLARHLDCALLGASGADEALALLTHTIPDLMLLDQDMPGMNGVELVRHLRAVPALAAIKVAMLSARRRFVGELEALNVTTWLSKPVLPGDVLDTVVALLADD